MSKFARDAIDKALQYKGEAEQLRAQLAEANETIAALSLETDNAISLQAERNQLRRELAKANERVRELEGFADAFLQLKGEEVVCSYCGKSELCKDFDIFNGGTVDGLLNKFAIDNQVKGAKALIYAFPLNASDQMKEWVEQLSKEQE